jgi:hypothetical protein
MQIVPQLKRTQLIAPVKSYAVAYYQAQCGLLLWGCAYGKLIFLISPAHSLFSWYRISAIIHQNVYKARE